VLVLNQNYEPLSVCNARRAILMLYRQKAEVIEHSDHQVRSMRLRMAVPSVVRISCYVRKPRAEVKLSKQNIVRRDSHTCQYCGTSHGPMTTDHIIPKSQGGEESWENLVCACVPCNNRKGDRSLKQAQMLLLRKPKKPHFITFIQYHTGIPDQRWRPYLFLGTQ
jgi:5-methylcytosine-specific restriction endonuclease McrA